MIYGDGFADGMAPGAIGWLIGEENRGLACMFTMMNNARLAVGMQGVAVAEAAYQQALRLCQRAPAGQAAGYAGDGHGADRPPSRRAAQPAHHEGADAGGARHRLLLRPRDRHGARRARDEAAFWQERANLLTPIAKAFATDIGVEVASIGVQVHGGMGFIEETGAAAASAAMPASRRSTRAPTASRRSTSCCASCRSPAATRCAAYIAELRADVDARAQLQPAGFRRARPTNLDRRWPISTQATAFLGQAARDGDSSAALAGATPYLRLFALAAGGVYLARGALARASASASRSAASLPKTSSVKAPALQATASPVARESLAAAASIS